MFGNFQSCWNECEGRKEDIEESGEGVDGIIKLDWFDKVIMLGIKSSGADKEEDDDDDWVKSVRMTLGRTETEKMTVLASIVPSLKLEIVPNYI